MSDSIVIRSMLFADVVGFSNMPDPAYPFFISEFLAEVEAVLSHHLHPTLTRNTWGDAIFAVFNEPHEAARAALALQRLVVSNVWSARFGMAEGSAELRLRIGLHAGPVHKGFDPITKTDTYVGRHTNLASRIEPIAEEGHVYVSGEFAALVTVSGCNEFQFEYVGQLLLPKRAGVIPVFRLVEAIDPRQV